MSRNRVRIERGLYRDGSIYYACATPPGSRSAAWKSLGAVGKMEARRCAMSSLPRFVAVVRANPRVSAATQRLPPWPTIGWTRNAPSST